MLPSKRLVASFASVVILLAIAGVLELLLLVFPASGEESGDAGASAAIEDPSFEGEGPAGGYGDSEGEPGEQSAQGDGGSQGAVSSEADETDGEDPASSESGVSEEAREAATLLVESGAIVVDGEPLDQERAEHIVLAARPFVDDVEYIDQRDILPAGCEIIALTVAMHAEGLAADPEEIAEKHLDTSGSTARSYGGSPWVNGGGFPPSIVDAGNSWLADQLEDTDVRVIDFTGTAFEGVLALAKLGYPVCVWTTEGLVDPAFYGVSRGGLEWYFPEHCVVVYGREDDEVLVSDSLAGLVRHDIDEFEDVYEKCGNMAVLVLP